MATKSNDLLKEPNNPFNALEGGQERDLSNTPPKSGQKIDILGKEYFVVSRGTEEGTDVYVMGEVVNEDTLPNYSEELLREAEVPENYVAHALDGKVHNFSVQFGEFDEEDENVVTYGGETYFKLDGEL